MNRRATSGPLGKLVALGATLGMLMMMSFAGCGDAPQVDSEPEAEPIDSAEDALCSGFASSCISSLQCCSPYQCRRLYSGGAFSCRYCGSFGEYCDSNANCCSPYQCRRLYSGGAFSCRYCGSFGEHCDSNANCCSGICTNGKCK